MRDCVTQCHAVLLVCQAARNRRCGYSVQPDTVFDTPCRMPNGGCLSIWVVSPVLDSSGLKRLPGMNRWLRMIYCIKGGHPGYGTMRSVWFLLSYRANYKINLAPLSMLVQLGKALHCKLPAAAGLDRLPIRGFRQVVTDPATSHGTFSLRC
jgi:hypothetical protein